MSLAVINSPSVQDLACTAFVDKPLTPGPKPNSEAMLYGILEKMMEDIDQLSALLRLGQITEKKFLCMSMHILSREVGCSRSGLWLFGSMHSGARALRCVALCDRTRSQLLPAAEYWVDDNEEYFLELASQGNFLADEVRLHPLTARYYDRYFKEHDIRSMMAVAFSLNGRLFGAATCSQIGFSINWTKQHLATATKIGAKVTLSLAESLQRDEPSTLFMKS